MNDDTTKTKTQSMTIDKETATVDFERWADAMRIDLVVEGLDENDQRDNDSSKALMIKAICQGALVIDDENLAVFTPEFGNAITWRKPKGSAFVAMDKKKKSQDFGKVFASMADITATAPVTFSKMDVADVKICMAIWSLFLV